MEFFKIRRDIPFMGNALVFNVDLVRSPSCAAVFFLCTRGLHLSVEFTGGTVMEVAYAQPADVEKVRARRSQGWASPTCRCRTSAPRATC